MQARRYDPTQYERQHRRLVREHGQRDTPEQCPNCGEAHHLVLVNGGWECWSCDEFIPRTGRRQSDDY